MPPTLLTGDLAVDIINQSQRVIDMDDKIAQLEPDASPLIVLLKKLKKVPAISPKVEWLEDERMPRLTTLSASATSNAASLSVTDNIFRVGDVLRITSNGVAFEVTATGSGTVSGNIGLGRIGSASSANGAEVFIVGNVNAEGASLRQIKTVRLANAYNYTEIVRTPVGITGTEAASRLYGGPDRDRLQASAAVEHMRQWEHIVFMGVRREDTSTSGAPKRFAGGLYEFITTNVTSVGGAMNESTNFYPFLRSGFRFGSSRKVAFISPIVAGAIAGFAKGQTGLPALASGEHASEFGVNVTTYVSPFGIVDLIMHKDWNDAATAGSGLGGSMYLVDIDALLYRPLRDTKLLENRQANDADKIEDEYLTEASFEVQHERRHALAQGITG